MWRLGCAEDVGRATHVPQTPGKMRIYSDRNDFPYLPWLGWEMKGRKRLSKCRLVGNLEHDAGGTSRQKRVPFRDLRPLAAFTC